MALLHVLHRFPRFGLPFVSSFFFFDRRPRPRCRRFALPPKTSPTGRCKLGATGGGWTSRRAGRKSSAACRASCGWLPVQNFGANRHLAGTVEGSPRVTPLPKLLVHEVRHAPLGQLGASLAWLLPLPDNVQLWELVQLPLRFRLRLATEMSSVRLRSIISYFLPFFLTPSLRPDRVRLKRQLRNCKRDGWQPCSLSMRKMVASSPKKKNNMPADNLVFKKKKS